MTPAEEIPPAEQFLPDQKKDFIDKWLDNNLGSI
jgi:hypothetical protein